MTMVSEKLSVKGIIFRNRVAYLSFANTNDLASDLVAVIKRILLC